MNNSETAVVMPIYNEEEGIFQFISSIFVAFEGECYIYVVDDHSQDDSFRIVSDMKKKYQKLFIIRNEMNLGHGMSTLKAMNFALIEQHRFIITVDGDGQIDSSDIRKINSILLENGADIVEGVRTNRFDGKLRRLISDSTRAMVFLKTNQMPRDANTPFRGYRSEKLQFLLNAVPNRSLIPNIWISILTRKNSLNYVSLLIDSKNRIGASKIGSTWSGIGIIHRYFKLLRFCLRASLELLSKTKRNSFPK